MDVHAEAKPTLPPLCPAGSQRPETESTTSKGAPKVEPAQEEQQQQQPRRIPQSLEEVDNGKIMGFGADLAKDHPGFHDQAYKTRRMDIANLARAHRV
jgi:hypothetical protein